MSAPGLSPGQWLRSQALTPDEATQPSEGPSALERVFAEEPVSLDVFIRDQRFVGMSALSDPQYEVLRYAERIFYPGIYPQMAAEWGAYWDGIPIVNFLTLLIGKGGG